MEETPSTHREKESERQLARVFDAAGCATQTELAKVFGIAQASVAVAKRRGSIPSDWILKLLSLHGINPDWISYGKAPKYIVSPSKDESAANERLSPARHIDGLIIRKILHCFPTSILAAELHRRKQSVDKKV